MARFIVSIPIETFECYEVEAESEEEAKELVALGQGEPVDNDYYITDENNNNWTVEKQED